MVFIGWRRTISKISDEFKNIWVSFIRNFNRLKKDTTQLKELQENLSILMGLVVQKRKEVKQENVKNVLTALWKDLESVSKQLEKIEQELDQTTDAEFKARKAVVEKNIKHTKDNIYLTANLLEQFREKEDLNEKKLTRREFFQKVGSYSKKALATLLLTKGGITVAIYEALLHYAEELPLRKTNGLAILISYKTPYWWDTALKPPAKLLIPAYVARIELAFGQKANLVKRGATKDDLISVLKEKAIQNIVIYGHGAWDTWLATDGHVWPDDLYYDGFNADRKTGLFVRHTCGNYYLEHSVVSLKYDKTAVASLIAEADEVHQMLGGSRATKSNPFSLEWIPDFVERRVKSFTNGSFIVRMPWMPNKDIEVRNLDEVGKVTELSMIYLRENISYEPLIDKIVVFLSRLRDYVKENKSKTFIIPELFGSSHYKKEQIKGWDRVSYPAEFMTDVFGKEYRSEDELYKEAYKEAMVKK